MRRSWALMAAIAVVLLLPSSALATKATRYVDHSVNLYCDGIHPVSGSGFVYFGAFSSDVNGSDAWLDYWTTDEPDAPSALTRDYDQAADVAWDGTTLRGSFALRDASGDAAGSASFAATLTPVGDPYPLDDSFKDGNTKFRLTGTGQAAQPAGSLLLPGGVTFDLAACTGDMSTASVFATNPKSFTTHFDARTMSCEITNGAGDTARVFTDLSETESFVDAGVEPAAAGATALGATGSGVVVGGTLDATLETYDVENGELVDLPSSIHLTAISTGETFEVLMRDGTEKRVSRGELLDIEGTLDIGPYHFDLGACVGADYRAKVFRSPSQGPKPGGKVPVNDLPSGAKSMTVGSSTSVQTKGASPDREAPYDCLTFEDEPGTFFEVPVANTVWYKVKGTGGSVTFDTAGSDFDTVAAVYTASGSAYTPVADACVDDVPTVPFGRTLQAAVTFPTVAGTWYYVQIGGYPSDFPYGNLRVAVR